MSHGMHNFELEIEKILDADSEFIESLCKQLEKEGIHLTNELLEKILTIYEAEKFKALKNLIEYIMEQEDIPLNNQNGSSIIQVVVDGKKSTQEKEELDSDFKIDSKYII